MSIKTNLDHVRSQIHKALVLSKRENDLIKIIAVTKTHGIEVIKEAIEYGFDIIGESKVQEAEVKIPLFKDKYREFHFIGHLQSNKIKKLLELNPSLIQSIDSFSLAEKLNKQLIELNRIQNILIEVNTSNEDSKFGIAPEKLLMEINKFNELSNVRVQGLMTIGTLTENKVIIRSCFKYLRDLSENIKRMHLSNIEMKYLSMGMSDDFIIALEEGSNMIRLGSILFGSRNYEKEI